MNSIDQTNLPNISSIFIIKILRHFSIIIFYKQLNCTYLIITKCNNEYRLKIFITYILVFNFAFI